MTGSTHVDVDDLTQIANSLAGNLKCSYSAWEDVVAKSSKFHSALKTAVQASSSFFTALQHIADFSTKNDGGSKEIGDCLIQLCEKQKSFEAQLKSMSNHLLSTLSGPLSSKLDEWKRNLILIEKNRANTTKRPRIEFKQAVTEYNRWRKKASRYGVDDTLHTEGNMGSVKIRSNEPKALTAASRATLAMRDLHRKTDSLRDAEKAAIRNLMLEDRARLCFFASCLMPLLDCQLTLLRDMSTLKSTIHSLSKLAVDPSKLLGHSISVLERLGGSDTSKESAGFQNPDLLAADNGQGGSSDGDSGHMTMDHSNAHPDSDNQSLSSSSNRLPYHLTQLNNLLQTASVYSGSRLSVSGLSSHSSNDGCGTSSIKSESGSDPDIIRRDHSSRERERSSLDSRSVSAQMDMDDAHLSTLRRTAHYRASSTFTSPRHLSPSPMNHGGFTALNPTHSPVFNRPSVDPEWLRQLDSTDDDDNDEEDEEDQGETGLNRGTHDFAGGEYVQVQGDVPMNKRRSFVAGAVADKEESFSRHTISERSTHARLPFPGLSFNSDMHKSSSKDSGVDSSTLLYPNQALPPPVYTNLTRLANEVKRKLSCSSASDGSTLTSPTSPEQPPAHHLRRSPSSTGPTNKPDQQRRPLSAAASGQDLYSQQVDMLDVITGPVTSDSTLASSNGESRRSSPRPRSANMSVSYPGSRSEVSNQPLPGSAVPIQMETSPVGPICYTPPLPPAPPPCLWENDPETTTAHLMSELSEQLQQMAERTLSSNVSDDDFPPPPPDF